MLIHNHLLSTYFVASKLLRHRDRSSEMLTTLGSSQSSKVTIVQINKGLQYNCNTEEQHNYKLFDDIKLSLLPKFSPYPPQIKNALSEFHRGSVVKESD